MIGQFQQMEKNLILCVEDDYFVHVLVNKVLKFNNFDSILALNGKEALKTLEENDQVGIILLDMNLPVMDGYSFLEAMADHPEYNDIRIYITSIDDEAKFNEIAAARNIDTSGVSGYFQKPYDYMELISTLRSRGAEDTEQ